MERTLPKYPRILAIAPSAKGFGFAVVEGLKVLVDWGEKRVGGNKNAGCLRKVEEFIVHYEPDIVVLENVATKPFRRSKRIRMLSRRISDLAESRAVAVLSFSREQLVRTFFVDGRGTKRRIAEVLAKEFSEELDFRLPPKRRPWMSQDARMYIFDAIALALMVVAK